MNFTSNGNKYVRLTLDVPHLYYGANVERPFPGIEDIEAFTAIGGWLDQAYRTITLDEPATGDFLTWLEANAVKQ